MVWLKCAECGRVCRYRKATLNQKYGRNVPLSGLMHLVGASCAKADRLGNDPRGVRYRDLWLPDRKETPRSRPGGLLATILPNGGSKTENVNRPR